MTTTLEYYKAELATLREQLAPLEAKTMWIGTKNLGGDWVDTTAEHIAALKGHIKVMETIVTEVEARGR